MGDPCRTISEPLGGLKVTVRRPDTVRRRNSRLIAGPNSGGAPLRNYRLKWVRAARAD